MFALKANAGICHNFNGQLKGLCTAFCDATKCGDANTLASMTACTNILSKITPLLEDHNSQQGTSFTIELGKCEDCVPSTTCLADGAACNVDNCECCSGSCDLFNNTCKPTVACPQSCKDVIDLFFDDLAAAGDTPSSGSFCKAYTSSDGAINNRGGNAMNVEYFSSTTTDQTYFGLNAVGALGFNCVYGSDVNPSIAAPAAGTYNDITMGSRCVEYAKTKYNDLPVPDCTLCEHDCGYV